MGSAIPNLFDRKIYLLRRKKATGEADRLLSGRIAEELADRLLPIQRQFARTLLISDRPETALLALEADHRFSAVDVLNPPESDRLNLQGAPYDCILSLMDLHAVNDVPGYFAQIAQSMNPDALLLAALFAGDTLQELKKCWLEAESAMVAGATLRVAPMVSVRELGSLLQRAGLALPVADLDRITLRYDNPLALLQEIRKLGFSNPMTERTRKPTSRKLFASVLAAYESNYSDPDGRIRATMEIAWVQAWKPHASQQKPLKPGSAIMRLAKALNVSEEIP